MARDVLPCRPGKTIHMGKALATWLLVTTAAAAGATAPRDVVQSAVTRVVQAIEEANLARPEPQAGKANPDKLRVEIRRIANELFDFDEISRRARSRRRARAPARRPGGLGRPSPAPPQ